MKRLIRQMWMSATIFVCIYIAVFVVSLITIGDLSIVDTYRNGGEIVEVGYLLMNAKPKLILLGASNTREGLRPDELKWLFPDYEIHNLGMGGNNITSIIQAIRWLETLLPPETMRKSIFLIGIWYGMFVENQRRASSGLADFHSQQLATGFYRLENNEVVCSISPRYWFYVRQALRPYKLISRGVALGGELAEDGGLFISTAVRKSKLDWSVFRSLNIKPVVDENYKERAIAFWVEYMGRRDGSLAPEQFEELVRLCRITRELGAETLLVDLPIPVWHSGRSRFYETYQMQKMPYLQTVAQFPNVFYANIQDALVTQEGYYDSAHPQQHCLHFWTEGLKKCLDQAAAQRPIIRAQDSIVPSAKQ